MHNSNGQSGMGGVGGEGQGHQTYGQVPTSQYQSVPHTAQGCYPGIAPGSVPLSSMYASPPAPGGVGPMGSEANPMGGYPGRGVGLPMPSQQNPYMQGQASVSHPSMQPMAQQGQMPFIPGTQPDPAAFGGQPQQQQGHMPFIPGTQPDPAAFGGQTQQQQQPQFFMPGPPQSGQGGSADGGDMGGMNSLNFMMAGSNLLSGGASSWGQQYVQKVQQRMSWLSGTALNSYFAVNGAYVRSKLAMLLAPYLKQWTFTRQADQSGQQFQAPRTDMNAPDLYIPIMALWTYCVSLCGLQLLQGKFKPDIVYATVWNASAAWAVHALVASVILRAMNIQTSLPWMDLFAYTGYSFVMACFIIGVAFVGESWAYYGALLYGGLCMAVFLVRTIKRIMFAEARNYGRDLTATNYLLLSLALFQFPFAFWLTSVRIPALAVLLKDVFPHAVAAVNATAAPGEM